MLRGYGLLKWRYVLVYWFVEIENINDLFDVYVIMWVEISDEIYEYWL